MVFVHIYSYIHTLHACICACMEKWFNLHPLQKLLFLAIYVHGVSFCLRQMGHSHRYAVTDIDSLLAVLWEEETWISFVATSLQQPQRQLEPAEIRLKT